MENISKNIGNKIKMYRKAKNMTLLSLANKINKSKSSVSKYENGEIVLDVTTLSDISSALNVPIRLFFDVEKENDTPSYKNIEVSGKSVFFSAKELHFYFYDGRDKKLKTGLIEIDDTKDKYGKYKAYFRLSMGDKNVFYTGNAVYSDVLIRFSFVNKYNALEKDLLYIFNPLDYRSETFGLLCGIKSYDFTPCAFKCLISTKEKDLTRDMIDSLLFTKDEINYFKKMNMLVVDNN